MILSGTALPLLLATALASAGDDATWPFLAPPDPFRADAAFDLRSLNEATAGASGFVRLAQDGESFVLGDGTPARFWAACTGVQDAKTPEELARHARFLAKRGVNMVRFHNFIEPKAADARPEDVDEQVLDRVWHLVAAMKKEGIYTTISPYWAGSARVKPSWGIEGWPEGEGPQGLLFFNDRLQAHYRAWLKALMTRKNPYTGIPLARDPALAIFQLQNEDSLLFWTQQNLKGKQLELLGRKFGDWLVKKYGSLDKARAAWKGESMPEDRMADGIVGIQIVWQFTQPRDGGLKTRLDDQLAFFGETMRRFNEETAKYLRDELGCKQLINAGNWRTVDTIRLDDVERWSYTGNEVIAVNRYFSPAHQGPDAGWRIDPGDLFEDRSLLTTPRELPIGLRQVAGRPMIVSESLWVPPTAYQSEGPFLVAAYQSLNGVDAFYWFNTGEVEWADKDYAEWNAASRTKWTFATPMLLGQFPAAATMYRKGYITQGKPVVVEHRTRQDLWERRPPLIAEDPGYDPNRDLGDAAKRSNLKGGVSPLAFLVGPVRVVFDSDPKKTTVADLSKRIDAKQKAVTSETGQLRWDYGQGICGLNAPKAQGVTGFLNKAKSFRLKDVEIRSEDDYATVLVVPLDDQPLATSGKILVQIGTRARPTDWVEKATTFKSGDGKTTYEGKQVTATGTMPWRITLSKLSILVKNTKLTKATRLDPNGDPNGDVKVERRDNGLALALPPDTLYVVLQ